MSDPAIEVRGLGKRFQIAGQRASYELLTEAISSRVRTLGRRPKPSEFWALRDIDFEVNRGETLGIIGHNGAGKSTLLKILSRITPPTEGEARLRGRVGALLEVGTGFHPELTGRENVFLNGAILSMKRREIMAKFDEIVAFADIGPFLDTPVKRYSSGMQMRLAFSVAAHLEPEVLIIDEVLSVGDAAFQEKCLGRMESASREGRTVVFISHNLASVRALCDRAILLTDGRITARGNVSEVIDAYVGHLTPGRQSPHTGWQDRNGDGRLRFTDIRFESGGRKADNLTSGSDSEIVLTFETADGLPVPEASFGIAIFSLGETTPLLELHSVTAAEPFSDVPGHGEARCRLPRTPLPSGQYYLTVWSEVASRMADGINHAMEVTVAPGDFFGSGKEPPGAHRAVFVEHVWSVTGVTESAVEHKSSETGAQADVETPSAR